ncbi:hypothetical protein [uncultured Legionella sp.]|uniref:hypothetical protein n=1 Tax=uncultured Legionella sp. TaxID=210934 RepID=UPI00261B73D5|nr:hypothetical protein [uncultured Legionella sp.]
MKIKTDAIAIPKDVELLLEEEQDQPSDTMKEDVQANKYAIREYIASARQHMEGLKAELYKVLDAGYDSAEHYSPVKPMPKIFGDKPSVFIERAYTIQVYDENGAPCENRRQDYIQAGLDYSKYCETNAQILKAPMAHRPTTSATCQVLCYTKALYLSFSLYAPYSQKTSTKR